jgi:hypothetical protein
MVFPGGEKIRHPAIVAKKRSAVIVPVNRHCQRIANTHSEKRASNLRKILMPVFVHAEVLESGMLHPGKGSGRRRALPAGFRRAGFFQAHPFPVQQADSPADGSIGDQAGLG